MSEHTPTPWFVSGVRFRMNGGEWLSVNRYDEALKRDENVALVGYDPRNGAGAADAAFIVKAVDNHDALIDLLTKLRRLDWATNDGLAGLRSEVDAMLAAVGITGESKNNA
jgi:hypothetical protein